MTNRIARTIVKDLSKLKQKSLRISDSQSNEALDHALDIWRAIDSIPCMGLAAVQLGLSSRMFVAAVPHSLKAIHLMGSKPNKYPDQFPSTLRYGVFINPEIVWTSSIAEYAVESCISLPGTFCFVPRFVDIKIKYQTLGTDEARYARLSGLFARVFQHEYDHLDGILITDRHVEPKTVVKRKSDLLAIEDEIKQLAADELQGG